MELYILLLKHRDRLFRAGGVERVWKTEIIVVCCQNDNIGG